MVPDLPENYVFMLLPCFRESCPHKVCAQGQQQWTWYDGGPYLSVLPLPVPDSQRPWGGSCKTCLGSCTGHYLPAEKVVVYFSEKWSSILFQTTISMECHRCQKVIIFYDKH